MKHEKERIIDALATYICVTAKKEALFVEEVDIDEIAKALGASYSEQKKAHQRAREILRDFM